ncbi:helix-turn-helix transcriptional regulator [Diaminobutyricibacter tongyongensis]|uniref:Helix-turn-helix transcriptional regulator n=1 Tax=Leifsonia tongyongensis TaxID=1268043 RepID=A0A6L9XV53_9MICO|nr:TetR/AcrR family transcriptional regulator [Diaminobutyricibacter tongyongensis]NEN05311.1 helix-turn-helix transcriptional regulator [Diaminobutyricibacter tongyongensis]
MSELSEKPLRADAARNVEGIRQAALSVFRRGLDAPLDEVAEAAGVSKGTIYNRFGGRSGLIDSIIRDLVSERFTGILERVDKLTDPLERFESFLTEVWLLQYDEPAANDVLLRTMPDSPTALGLGVRMSNFGERLLHDAQTAGVVRNDLLPEDLYLLIWERGLIARACDPRSEERHRRRPSYQRRLEFVLAGLRQNAYTSNSPEVATHRRASGKETQ